MAHLSNPEIKHGLSLYGDLPYHGKHHPFVVLSAAHRIALGHGQVTPVVQAAILLHDAGYIPGANDNEERAAHVHVPEVLGAAWDVADIKRVSAIVMDTKEHHPDRSDRESCLVSDADMDGFAMASWDEFQANNDDVEAEYLTVGITPAQYAAGRRAFLERTLDDALTMNLYHSDGFRRSRTAQAALNISRLLGVDTELVPGYNTPHEPHHSL